MKHQADPVSLALCVIQHGEENKVIQDQRNKNQMIREEEEAKIKRELEMEIERDLEGEIKEEITRLALRLHHLYQHQHDKLINHNHHHPNKQIPTKLIKHKNNKIINKSKALSEVNISIKMEGGTKVEIKEIKKPEISTNHGHMYTPLNHNNYSAFAKKRFDWANSLRSGPRDSCDDLVVRTNKGTAKKHHPKTPRQIRPKQCAWKW